MFSHWSRLRVGHNKNIPTCPQGAGDAMHSVQELGDTMVEFHLLRTSEKNAGLIANVDSVSNLQGIGKDFDEELPIPCKVGSQGQDGQQEVGGEGTLAE